MIIAHGPTLWRMAYARAGHMGPPVAAPIRREFTCPRVFPVSAHYWKMVDRINLGFAP